MEDMQKVVLDTNALLMPFEFSLNLDSELKRLLGSYEVHVPSAVIGELSRSKKKHAKVAAELAGKYAVDQIERKGDESVVELAAKLNAYVVTNDKLLIAKLRKMRIGVILLRSRSHLALDGD